MKKNILILLIAITFLGAFLRLYQVGTVPPSPDWDEVSSGYNAYSILKTGRDEYGFFMPVVLISYGDFKPILYTYLTIPFIQIFDLTLVAVRMPSIMLGILGVVAVYFLVKELFNREDWSLLSSFLFAISPWSLQFSRTGFEAHSAVVFNIFTVLFFLKGLKRAWYLPIAALFAGLSLYMYQSEKVFMPMLVLLIVCLYWEKIIVVSRKYLIATVLYGILIVTPLLLYMLAVPQSLARAQMTSIFSQNEVLLSNTSKRLEYNREHKDVIGLIVNNRRVTLAKELVGKYLLHYDFNFLFIKGDFWNRHHAPNMGLLYLVELPFLLIGLYTLVFHKFSDPMSRKGKVLILGWFLIAPLPSAMTIDSPHAVRSMNLLPTFQIFIAIGISTVYFFIQKSIKKRFIQISLYSVFIVCAIFNFLYFFNQYFVQLNYYYSGDWQYGYKELITYVDYHKDEYEKVIVSNRNPLDQSYMFFLFYTKYPPAEYQKEVENISKNKYISFGKYEFRGLQWEQDKTHPDRMYVGGSGEFPKDKTPLKTIYYIDGHVVMKVVDTK